MTLKIRRAKPEDMSALLKMIKDLADFEEMPDGPQLTVEALKKDCFGTKPPLFECFLLEEETTGTFMGYTMFFKMFSTCIGQALWMEDIYVHENFRLCGYGQKILSTLCNYCVKDDLSSIYFNVLDWNPARNFYHRYNAENLSDTEKRFRFRLPLDELKSINVSSDTVRIRDSTEDDSKVIYDLIKEHAAECGMLDKFKLTLDCLRFHGFQIKEPNFHCFVAMHNNEIVGYAMIYNIYSTWLGKSLMVDDMYIRPNQREPGMKTLLEHITKYAIDRSYNRVDINAVETDRAFEHYERFGAVNINKTESWLNHRFNYDTILDLAKYT